MSPWTTQALVTLETSACFGPQIFLKICI